jgi:hypothetical protein
MIHRAKDGWEPIMGGEMKDVEASMKPLLIDYQLKLAESQGLESVAFGAIKLIKITKDQVSFLFFKYSIILFTDLFKIDLAHGHTPRRGVDKSPVFWWRQNSGSS